MQKNAIKSGLSVAACALSLLAAPAKADTIELNSWWAGNTWDANIVFNGTNYHNGAPTSLTEGGGAGGFKTYNLTTDPGRNNSFQSWCVDIFHSFGFASQSSDILQTAASIFGATKATDLGRLATNHYANVASNATPGATSAAFQLAIWEIVNENTGNPYSLSAGAFTATGTGAGLAATWLSELNNIPSGSTYSVKIWEVQGDGPSGSGSQDVAVFTSVPEPDSYAMILAGLGLAGFIARRRRKQ